MRCCTSGGSFPKYRTNQTYNTVTRSLAQDKEKKKERVIDSEEGKHSSRRFINQRLELKRKKGGVCCKIQYSDGDVGNSRGRKHTRVQSKRPEMFHWVPALRNLSFKHQFPFFVKWWQPFAVLAGFHWGKLATHWECLHGRARRNREAAVQKPRPPCP